MGRWCHAMPRRAAPRRLQVALEVDRVADHAAEENDRVADQSGGVTYAREEQLYAAGMRLHGLAMARF